MTISLAMASSSCGCEEHSSFKMRKVEKITPTGSIQPLQFKEYFFILNFQDSNFKNYKMKMFKEHGKEEHIKTNKRF